MFAVVSTGNVLLCTHQPRGTDKLSIGIGLTITTIGRNVVPERVTTLPHTALWQMVSVQVVGRPLTGRGFGRSRPVHVLDEMVIAMFRECFALLQTQRLRASWTMFAVVSTGNILDLACVLLLRWSRRWNRRWNRC